MKSLCLIYHKQSALINRKREEKNSHYTCKLYINFLVFLSCQNNANSITIFPSCRLVVFWSQPYIQPAVSSRCGCSFSYAGQHAKPVRSTCLRIRQACVAGSARLPGCLRASICSCGTRPGCTDEPWRHVLGKAKWGTVVAIKTDTGLVRTNWHWDCLLWIIVPIPEGTKVGPIYVSTMCY